LSLRQTAFPLFTFWHPEMLNGLWESQQAQFLAPSDADPASPAAEARAVPDFQFKFTDANSASGRPFFCDSAPHKNSA
jgi:hypothetical protein